MKKSQRLSSIDAIRFVCALVVVLHHAPPPEFIGTPEIGYRSALFGSAAVVVFFVISGLCIHAPLASVTNVVWRQYFCRRYVRLLLPLVCVALLGSLAGVSYHPLYGAVTWSLVCELIFYALYPAFRLIAASAGWAVVLALGYVSAYAFMAAGTSSPDDLFGTMLQLTVTNLPAWLLGCVLAEILAHRHAVFWPVAVTLARVAIVTLSCLLGWLHYAAIAGFPWTSPLFAAVVACWLYVETTSEGPPGLMSAFGLGSYSLYLLHPIVLAIVPHVAKNAAVFPVAVTASLVAAALFYRLIELPSHVLARRLALRLDEGQAKHDRRRHVLR